MTIIYGLSYACYFLLLGYAVRASYNLIANKPLYIERKTDFFAHAFFLGVFIHVLFFNALQYTSLSNRAIVLTTALALIISILSIVIHGKKLGIKTRSIKPSVKDSILIVCIVLFSSVIYWNAAIIPNIAWDSWMVWVGKADQWIIHGLSVDIKQFDAWLLDDQSISNVSAHYPDALSLIYFLPKLINAGDLKTTNVLYLFAYAMITLLLVSRLKRSGAPFYLQLFLIVVMYSTPFLNTHLMIQGYADIWIAMFIVLIMLTFMDFHDKKDGGVAITLVVYLMMLPMLKLEGWVWLLLFIAAHFMTILSQLNLKLKASLILLSLLAILFLFGGIHLQLPAGNITVNTSQIEFLNLINTPIQFENVTNSLMVGFFWQNNWSFLWIGLPFLLVSFFVFKHNKASQISHVFMVLALLCFMVLFYFTEASKWAKDLTALNRIVLQLTPCYLFLLFKMLNRLKGVRINQETQATT